MKKGKFIFIAMLIAVIAVAFALVFACTTPGEESSNDGGTTSSGTSSSGTSSSEASSSSSSDDGKIHIAYVTDAAQTALYNTDNTAGILYALKNDSNFVVTEVNGAAAGTTTACLAADLVIISEVCKSAAAGLPELKGINKPVLMMKQFAYKSGVWSWLNANPGQDTTAISNLDVLVPSHPIFTSLGSPSSISLITAVSGTKGYSYYNPATAPSGNMVDPGATNYTKIATLPGQSTQVCITEFAAGSSVVGTVIPQKFIDIGITGDSFGFITANGITVIKNTIYYLTDNTIPVTSSSSSSSEVSSVSSESSSEVSSSVSSESSSEASSESSSSVASSTASLTAVLYANFQTLPPYLEDGITAFPENTEITIASAIALPTVTNTHSYSINLIGKLRINTTQAPPTGAPSDCTLGNYQSGNNTASIGKVTISNVQGPFTMKAYHRPTANDVNRLCRVTINGTEVYLGGSGATATIDTMQYSYTGTDIVNIEIYGYNPTATNGAGLRITDLWIYE